MTRHELRITNLTDEHGITRITAQPIPGTLASLGPTRLEYQTATTDAPPIGSTITLTIEHTNTDR